MIWKSLKFEDWIQENVNCTYLSEKKFILFIMDAILKLHPYEKLIVDSNDIFYLTPRGLDFLQEVVLPFLQTSSQTTSFEKRYRLDSSLQEKNLSWSVRWIELLFEEKSSISIFPSTDFLLLNEVSSMIGRNVKEVRKKISIQDYELQRCCKIKNRIYFTADGFREFFKIRFPIEYSVFLSKKISESKNLNQYEQAKEGKNISWIDIKKFQPVKNQIKFNFENKNEFQNVPKLFKGTQVGYKKLFHYQDLVRIQEYLQQTHPFEKMIYKIWDTRKNEFGEIYFTSHGIDWLSHCSLILKQPLAQIQNKILEEDLKWSEQIIKKIYEQDRNVVDEFSKSSIPLLLRIYGFQDYQAIDSYIKSSVPNFCDFDENALYTNFFQTIEKNNPIYKLRKYSWIIAQSQYYRNTILQHQKIHNSYDRKNDSEISSLHLGWHRGYIIGKIYYTKKNTDQEKLILKVLMEHGKEIKLRLPSKKIIHSKINFLFDQDVPIKFKIQKNDNQEKYVSEFVLWNQIHFTY